MFWIITWAGLLLLVLYSPIGSPDLYRSETYLSYSPGVNFQKSTFKNSNFNHQQNDNYVSNYTIPQALPQNGMSSSYTYSNSNTYNSNKNEVIPLKSPYNTDNSNSPQTVSNYIGSDNYVYLNSGTKSGYIAPKFSGQNLSSNLLINQNSSTPFLAKQDVTGGTDPGGDPNPDPIPVGDATWILMIMAITYMMLRKKHFKYQL